MDIQYIEFFDHWSGGEDWESLKEAGNVSDGGVTCQSVGWIVGEDDRVVRLAPNLNDAGSCFGTFTILKCAIIRRVSLSSAVPPPK